MQITSDSVFIFDKNISILGIPINDGVTDLWHPAKYITYIIYFFIGTMI